MKPLVNTSVFGLLPLPQLPESDGEEWKPLCDAPAAQPRELNPGDLGSPLADDKVANPRCSPDRMGRCAHLILAIWRRLSGTC
jgi:hypothetical protein